MSGLPVADPRPELRAAVDAAARAGAEVMEVYAGEFTAGTKEDDSPVTEADIRSNRAIKDVLGGSGHWILSEEDPDSRGRLGRDLVWIVDPLDGTADFVKRTGEFTVMIALVEGGAPVVGVILWPAGDTLFVAQRGAGAYRRTGGGAWRRMRVTGESELRNCRAVGSRNHLSDRERSLFKGLGVREFTGVGSSLKVGKISSGEAEVYVTTTDRMKEWDSCASSCIISEAGGRMTDALGNALTYNNEEVGHPDGIVASNGAIHDRVIEGLRRLGQAAGPQRQPRGAGPGRAAGRGG